MLTLAVLPTNIILSYQTLTNDLWKYETDRVPQKLWSWLWDAESRICHEHKHPSRYWLLSTSLRQPRTGDSEESPDSDIARSRNVVAIWRSSDHNISHQRLNLQLSDHQLLAGNKMINLVKTLLLDLNFSNPVQVECDVTDYILNCWYRVLKYSIWFF